MDQSARSFSIASWFDGRMTNLQLPEYLLEVAKASLCVGERGQRGVLGSVTVFYYSTTVPDLVERKYYWTNLCNVPVLFKTLSLEEGLRGIGKVLSEGKQLCDCHHSFRLGEEESHMISSHD